MKLIIENWKNFIYDKVEEVVIRHDAKRPPAFTSVMVSIARMFTKDKNLEELLPNPDDRKMFMSEVVLFAEETLDKMLKDGRQKK